MLHYIKKVMQKLFDTTQLCSTVAVGRICYLFVPKGQLGWLLVQVGGTADRFTTSSAAASCHLQYLDEPSAAAAMAVGALWTLSNCYCSAHSVCFTKGVHAGQTDCTLRTWLPTRQDMSAYFPTH
jgi:hypothetical protein